MTLTIDPKTRPIDFERLLPFVDESVDRSADESADESAEGRGRSRRRIRRPGAVGAVIVRPLIAEATPAEPVVSFDRRVSRLASATTVMDPAIARRRAELARAKARVTPAMFATSALIVLVLLLVGMFSSPWMSVRAVEVEGADPAVSQQVRKLVEHRLGTPMVRFPVDEVRRTIQNQPDIATVEVSKRWPEAIEIRVTVRDPFALISVEGGDRQLMDRAGVLLPMRPTGPLPLIDVNADTGANSDEVGSTVAERLEKRRLSALAILGSLDEQTRRAVDRVDNFGDDFVLRIGKSNVLVGRPDDLTAKAMLIGSLQRSERLPKSGTIDVTIPDAVILDE